MKSVDQPIIIADSISPQGIRLTTWQLRYWRAIHAELMTHRVFSRNAGSSRARPAATIIESVMRTPYGPLHWGANQSGMQAAVEHNEPVRIPQHLNQSFVEFCRVVLQEDYRQSIGTMHFFVTPQEGWHFYAWLCSSMSGAFNKAGYHKQVVNRMTETVNYIDVVLTSTDFNNWFALRDHPDAQPEIQNLASQMKRAHTSNIPNLLQPGEWHLPYINSEDWVDSAFLTDSKEKQLELLRKASAARCARVSYKLFDGSNAKFDKDLELFHDLLVSQPLHATPAEHQATPDTALEGIEPAIWRNPSLHGNLHGWIQHRKMLPNEFVPG